MKTLICVTLDENKKLDSRVSGDATMSLLDYSICVCMVIRGISAMFAKHVPEHSEAQLLDKIVDNIERHVRDPQFMSEPFTKQ